jgi:adenylate cyclase
LKVLAVDDNPDNIQLITDIVSMLGHEVIPARNGREALDAVKASPRPDLILLDINMPGMSGFDVISQLKADEETAQIPVIMVTAQASVDYRVEGLGLGAEDYLVKPYSPRELIARIETRLRSKTEIDSLREMRELVQKTFERFVSPAVVQQLLANPASVKLGGKAQEITVMFADIQGFTALAEQTDPEPLLRVLNRYHELIVEAIQAHAGTVDKFVGDAVMALYNTPLELDNHALSAVRTAHKIQGLLPEFHKEFEPKFRLTVNFGIHTGNAVVGNVGSSQIMEFTAIGDTVNVASRLEGLSENGQILISDATYEQIREYVEVRQIGSMTVKGRTVPVMTYDVIGLIDQD